jgi:hypothetical protein
MPNVSIPGLGVVSFPDTMSKEEIDSAIQKELPTALEAKRKQEEAQAALPPDLSMGEALKRSVIRGGKQISSALGDVIPAMAASAVGADEYAKRQMEEAAATQEEIARKYAAGVPSYKNVKDIGSGAQYLLESAGEQIPQLATALIPGGVGAVAGRRLALSAAKTAGLGLEETAAAAAAKQNLGQNIGVYLGSFSQNTPEVFQNIYNETGQLEPGAALLAGSVSSALDSALPTYLLNKITKPAKVGLVEKLLEKSGMEPGIIRKALSALPESVAMEGLTEGAQEAISMQAENFIDKNKGLFDSKGWDRILESTIKGAVAGGAFGTVAGGVEGIKDRVTQPQPSTEQPTPGAEPALTNIPQPTPPVSPSAAAINKALFVDEDLIKTLGLPLNAGIVKRIKDLEINQENAAKIQAELSKYQGEDKVKENIDTLLARPEFQGVQIGKQPRGTKTTGPGGNIPVSTGSTKTATTTQTTDINGAGNAGAGVDATKLAGGVEGSTAAKTNTLKQSAFDTWQKSLDGLIKTANGVLGNVHTLMDYKAVPNGRDWQIYKEVNGKYAYQGDIKRTGDPNHMSDATAINKLKELVTADKKKEIAEQRKTFKSTEDTTQKAANTWNSISSQVKFNDLVKEDQNTILDAHKNGVLDRDLVDEIVEGGGYLEYAKTGEPTTTNETKDTLTGHFKKEFGNNILGAIKRGVLNIVDSVDQLPPEVKAKMVSNAVGVFHKGKSYIIANRVNKDTARRTLLHEVGEHYGLENMLGKNLYNQVLQQVNKLNNVDPQVTAAHEHVSNLYPELQKGSNAYLREVLARIGESAPENTLWRRILGSIKNFLTKLGLYNPSRMDVADIHDMVLHSLRTSLKKAAAPVATDRTQFAKVLNGGVDPSGAKKLMDSVGDTVKKLPGYNTTIAREVRNVTSTLPDKLRGLALSFMSLPQKVELYGKDLPALGGLLKALELRGSTMERLHREVEDLTTKGIKIIQDKKYTPQVIAKFNRVGTELSARLMDPREYRNVMGKDGKIIQVKNTDYNPDDPLVQAWNSLPKELKDLGIEYAERYEKYRNQMIDMIEQLSGANLAAEMRKRFEKEKISFYFPLRRKGNYRLSYYDKKGIEQIVRHFETPAELGKARQDAIKKGEVQLDANNNPVFESSILNREVNYKETPPLGFVKKIVDKLGETIEDSPEKDALINDVYKMYLDLFPDDSIRQQMQKRQGVAGYIEDIVGGFADTGSRLATQLANLEHRPQLDALYKQLDEQKREYINGNPDKNIPPHTNLEENAAISQVVQDMNNQKKFIDNPVADSWSAQLSWVSYIWNIAGNISSALINLTQVPMVVMPMLGGEYTWNEAFDALSAAYKMYFKGGLFNDNNRNYMPDHTFGANLKPGDKHYKLYHAALNRSTIRRGIGYELNELRRKSAEDYTGTKSKINTALGWMFQNSERMNREVTLIAAYDLALKKNGGNVDAAIDKAIEITTRAHSHALSEAGPRMFQNGLGKVAFTFKRFAQTQIYNVARLFYVATKDFPKEERAIARRQLFGIMGMTYMFSGLQGLPLYGALNMLSTAIAGMFGDDDDPYDFDEEVRAAFGDLGYKGPLNQILNVDIAARTGFNGMVFHDDPRRLSEVGYGPYFIEHFFGPAYQTLAVNPVRAAKLWEEGHTERALETVMPSVTKNMMKSFRYATEGATTTNGIKVIDDPGAYNNLMQLFGFTNADLSEAYTRASSMKQAEQQILKRRTQLLDLHYLAKINGDDDMLDKINDDIIKYNSKVPAGIKITHDTISRSNRGHKEREKQARDGVVISKKLKDDIVERYGE